MTALVYAAPAWQRARAQRAAAGKGPRLAIFRTLALRQAPNGGWTVLLYARRYGVWSKPEQLCAITSFDDARAVAVSAWVRLRLPIARVLSTDNKLRPFYLDQSDMAEVRS